MIEYIRKYSHRGGNFVNYEVPMYSPAEVRKAGEILSRSESIVTEESLNALRVVDNWRASHAYPLQVFYTHFKNRYSTFVITQRIKRLPSIINKIHKLKNMDLSRMQDLGGCRIIYDTIENVYRIAQEYRLSRVSHVFANEKDYIQSPKKSGYRCLHMVYRYQSRSPSRRCYNGMRIEIQIRTHLQHLWATGVEIISNATKENLKSVDGDESMQRFFALVSSLFALRENTPLVPDTPATESEIVEEIRELNNRYRILDRLENISGLMEIVDRDPLFQKYKNGYLLLIRTQKQVSVIPYKPTQIDMATRDYNSIEIREEGMDVVLVRASSFDKLRQAYPNYYMDISEFIEILNQYI